MKRTGHFWARYFLAATVLIVSFSWLSWVMLDVVDQELESRQARAHREQLSEAIWRLDLWLAPLLGIEAARPVADYSSTVNPSVNFEQNSIGEWEPGQGFSLSPLFRAPSDYFQFHFEFGPPPAPKKKPDLAAVACSPYIPSDPIQEEYLVSNGLVTEDQMCGNREQLERTQRIVSDPKLYTRFEAAESKTLLLIASLPDPSSDVTSASANGTTKSSSSWVDNTQTLAMGDDAGWNTRAIRTNYAKMPSPMSNITQSAVPPPADVAPDSTGPLVSLWVDVPNEPGARELMFLRRVSGQNGPRFQGFLVDWSRLQIALHEQIADLAAAASLTPVLDEATFEAEAGRMLATMPVSLAMTPLRAEVVSSALPRWSLGVTWGALVIALLAFGFGFRAVISYGEKRSRFASAVTHELRTPLTTFQLYSEMLADGMITDEAKKAEYLETLRLESRRLSNVVENVLTYARVEDGRTTIRPVRLTIGELVDRMRPELERRAGDTGATLKLELSAEPDVELRTDPEAIGHVATNLIDNACKYACVEEGAEVRVRISVDGSSLILVVEDDGPGIPADQRSAIFAPFERAGRESSNIPGVGLGLSLSQNIASELGGTLRYLSDHSGACFELRIPKA